MWRSFWLAEMMRGWLERNFRRRAFCIAARGVGILILFVYLSIFSAFFLVVFLLFVILFDYLYLNTFYFTCLRDSI